ncbi:COX15/CtaA family protein [Verrucomicrobiales bacterium]|nr:COX15/CtaA family protein [Verrucomicrobiales bacterium]MDA7926519.1 COX15/CtaA family protein [Verrucomicrobiales bacterium]
MSNQISQPAFNKYSKLVAFFAVLLIWWGAATTTKLAGMAFADWPLSLGSLNPPGWLSYMVPFLEHSHRLLATLVGILVLGMFSWSYIRGGKSFFEMLIVVIGLAVIFAVFIMAGAERSDPGRKSNLLGLGLGLGVIPFVWLIRSWIKRSWTLVQKLSALALLMVTTQAIFGGLRVTEISNGFAVLHGCLAQAFFCLLVLIVMASGTGWGQCGFAASRVVLKLIRIGGVSLLALTSIQLVCGASMRHFHRVGLADTDLLKTAGVWIPAFDEPIILVLFLHKWTAFCIFGLVLALWLKLRKEVRIGKHLTLLLVLLSAQIALGLTVIATGKHFWITNFHVINGLAILAMAFVFVVKAIKGNSGEAALARTEKAG